MKTNSNNPKEDLQAIRDIMERSSKFLSLSGLSGVFAGVCALIGAAVVWLFILGSGRLSFAELIANAGDSSVIGTRFQLALVLLLVLVSAVSVAYFFSWRRARKAGHPFWNKSSRQLLLHLMIPLIAGGIFTMILIYQGNYQLVAAVLLIFYGLALVNAGKFTLGELHYLGLTEVFLGLLAAVAINWGLTLWTIGFGLMHVIYGTVMYYRHER